MTRWEAIAAIARFMNGNLDAATRRVDGFAAEAGLTLVKIGSHEGGVAASAHATCGKGRRPARLNMRDGFAHACAKTNNARPLYKGDDFSRTDLA